MWNNTVRITMVAGNYDITIDQGSAYSIDFTFKTVSSSANPVLVPVDLTGYTASAQMRDGYANTNFIVNFTCTFSGSSPLTGSIESGGKLTLSLLPSQTRGAEGGLRGVWDLFLYPNGNSELAERWLEGTAWIRSRVTR